ncbi:unnamed protein product [Mytilus edulis]|uniref:Uncharacterized protein n=1 Tax=Mytilus edulis TaxID=6550 RepID=A0A8S3UFQ2_MYTED|nr:unnamed protein product [Mytilus edulis]
MNNSRKYFGIENNRSPQRNGNSFRIMKNSYDLRQSPVTSPRDQYKANNIARDQTASHPNNTWMQMFKTLEEKHQLDSNNRIDFTKNLSKRQNQQTPPRRDDRNFNSGDRVTSPLMSEKKQSSSLQRLLESHHQERIQQQAQRWELAGSPTNADDAVQRIGTDKSWIEIRAKEYAENLNESQAKLNNFRNKMEELQFIIERKTNLHNRTKCETAERINNWIKESLSNTENKLYDARTEIVELKSSSILHGSFHDSFESPTSDYVPCPKRETPTVTVKSQGVKSPRSEAGSSSSRSKSPLRNSANGYEQLGDSVLESSIDQIDTSKVSPVMRAEQDLYRLRDMMRTIGQSPNEPPKFKLKKKFLRNNNGRPPSKLSVNPDEYSSPTRFDISTTKINQNGVIPRRHPGDGEPQRDEKKPSNKKVARVQKSRNPK